MFQGHDKAPRMAATKETLICLNGDNQECLCMKDDRVSAVSLE